MSGSEGKQNNQMSAKDIEAEEMAQELMSMEMYEEGMEYDEMKQILRVINESRDMAGIEPDNRSSQEVSSYLSETAAPEVSAMNNITQESTLEVNSVLKLRPKPSFSYRSQTEKDLPAGPSSKSSLRIASPEEMSVSSPEVFSTPEEPVLKRSTTESESIFDALINENELDKREASETGVSQAPVKNAWHNISDNSQNSQSFQSTEISVSVESFKSRKNQKIEGWKVDPTKAVIVDNDVPLSEKTRPLLHERVPYSFCHHKRALAASEKVMDVLTYQLEEVADIWRRKHKLDVSEFQWGSPIKVGSDNGSLDKKPVIEDPETPEKQQSIRRNQGVSSLWRNQDRQCKRKATEHIKDLNHDLLDSEEDSDNIFIKPKKSKNTDEPWLPESNSETPNSVEKQLTRQDKIFNNLNSIKTENPPITDYDSDEFDNDTLFSLRAKNKKKDQADNRVASPEFFLPRRIVPPNPAKPKSIIRPRNNGEKIKRKSPLRRNAEAVSDGEKDSGTAMRTRARAKNQLFKKGKEQIGLNDNEIADELEKPDTEEKQEEVEIKPLPVKGLANKLLHSAAMLLQSKKTEEKLLNAKTQEELRLQEEEKIKRGELIASRLRKEEEERRHKEAKDKEVKAKEEKWKKNEAIRDRDRRNRQFEEKKQAVEAEKNQISMNIDGDADDDDEDLIIGNADMKHRRMEEQMQCPICQKKFSQEDIQDHAANCNQFDEVGEPDGSHRPASDDDLCVNDNDELLVCNVCSQFSTTNGTAYENHVHACLQRKRGEGNSRTQLGTQTTVIEVPTSPVRCFVPISELTESAINYKEQHPKQLIKPKSLGNRRPRR